jgi:hypothetical protein
MAVTYTITSGDVASVNPLSKLTAGVVFDWTNQKIIVPSAVNSVNAQWLIDNCRFAEETAIGRARPQIVDGAGKTLIGIDPDTLAPINTPTVAILRDEWRLVTDKTSGNFTVRDIYTNEDASTTIPYDDVVNVFIQYLTSVTGAVATISTGSGLDAGQDAKLTAIQALTDRLDAMLESAGGYDRWLATALEMAPSGGGGSGLTMQQVRDAMKLTPSAGAANTNSIDQFLSVIELLARRAANASEANL